MGQSWEEPGWCSKDFSGGRLVNNLRLSFSQVYVVRWAQRKVGIITSGGPKINKQIPRILQGSIWIINATGSKASCSGTCRSSSKGRKERKQQRPSCCKYFEFYPYHLFHSELYSPICTILNCTIFVYYFLWVARLVSSPFISDILLMLYEVNLKVCLVLNIMQYAPSWLFLSDILFYFSHDNAAGWLWVKGS